MALDATGWDRRFRRQAFGVSLQAQSSFILDHGHATRIFSAGLFTRRMSC